MNPNHGRVMNNHADAEILQRAIAEQASVLAGCSQQAANKMLDLLTMTVVKLELLLAIEDEVNNAFDSIH